MLCISASQRGKFWFSYLLILLRLSSPQYPHCSLQPVFKKLKGRYRKKKRI
jgi:hypothetical protein